MTYASANSLIQAEPEVERRLSEKLHDLRTPLNQIIGFSEMLIETAGEDGHADLVEGLGRVREAGVEITCLLQDKSLIAIEAQAGGEYRPLADAVHPVIGRVLGFTDLLLADPAGARLNGYLDDVVKIRSAACHFLESANGCGLLIRLETAQPRENHAPASPGAYVPGKSPAAHGRVLIVDDESLNREVLCRRLQREGCHSVGASSGGEALDLLRNESFDVVLLDIVMPEMSGIEVLQTIKHDPQLLHLPVIMLSALTDVERVARCIELGAEDYLPKPINAVILRARLGACLEKKRLRDRERAHLQAIYAEKEQLSVTLRSLADVVATTDAQGRIVLLNDVGARLTGMSSEAAAGRPLEEVFRIFHRATGQPAANIAAEALARNAVVESEPGIGIMAPDGMERLVSVRCAPIHHSDGAARGAVVVMRDITEKEKVAEELLRASKLQSIGVLAGGLAHDFNNMLTAVLGNISLIRQRHDLPPELLPLVREAGHGALRMQELTRHLLTFSEGGAPVKQVVQARPLIEEASAFVVRGSNVHCEFRLPADLWEIEADPNQFSQVVSNIVLNAVEATPNGGNIRVSAENLSAPPPSAPHLSAGNYLRVSVRDCGAGIAPEHLSRIYDPFFTTKKQARGLGLAAAYSIVQRHGGHISIESVLGDGTTVEFYLRALRPVAPPQESIQPDNAPETPENESPGARPRRRRRRVLLMDDDDAIRMVAKIMFKQLDYEVVTTADGEAALAAHARALNEGRPFDFVVMDLTIPGGMGGKEAIRRLRGKDMAIRAIVSSGYSNDPVMAHCADYGFDGVLPKPYMMSDLANILQQLSPVESTPPES